MTAEQEEKLAALFNWGNKLLPASNTSLLSLIRRLAEEEREAARFLQSSSNASSTTTTTTNSTTTTRKLTVANKGPKRKSKEDKVDHYIHPRLYFYHSLISASHRASSRRVLEKQKMVLPPCSCGYCKPFRPRTSCPCR